MEHLDEILDRIINKDSPTAERVDELLELDRDVRDLGKAHTLKEKKESRSKSSKIYSAIYKIDKETGKLLKTTKDK